MDARNSMLFTQRLAILAVLSTALAACSPDTQTPVSSASSEAEAAKSADAAVVGGAVTSERSAESLQGEAEGARFDLASVPVSERALGEFPFIVVPEGYETIKEQTLNITQVPFWTGDRLEQVEGKALMATVQEQQGTTYSELEFKRNIEHVIKEAGGVLVTDSAIPSEVLETVSRKVRVDLVDGWGDVYNNPVQTYVIRTDAQTVWVHVCSDSAGAGLIVLEAR